MTKEEMEKQIHDFAKLMYKTGYKDGVVETEKINDKAHDDGYNKGLYDAWDCARKMLVDVVNGGFDSDTLKQIFGTPIIIDIFKINSASEAISAIKEYEEQQKQKLIANCITCKWDYRNYEKYLNVSEDEKVRHCNECYKNSGYELMSTEMKSCSILEDDCPYDIKCEECEVHCSVERAKQKLKGDKE